MQVSALRDFILSQGASKNVTVQEWDKIWTMNKKVCSSVGHAELSFAESCADSVHLCFVKELT